MSQPADKFWEAPAERQTIKELFAADGGRFYGFSIKLDDLLLDFSKTSISPATLRQLLDLAKAAGVERWRDDMFAGEVVNGSEQRQAMHFAIRGDVGSDTVYQHGASALPEIKKARGEMLDFAEAVRSGAETAADGKPYTDVLCLGVGGSNLGAQMAVAALAPYGGGLRLHFAANMDGAELADTLPRLDSARTLVLVASKTFTTAETMRAARAVRQWLSDALGRDAVQAQCCALTAEPAQAANQGFTRVFRFWQWVGGRTSIWSAVGLPLALAIGKENFEKFLEGAAAMDTHFCRAPLEKNMPVLLALVGVWHRNVCNYPTRAVVPYDARLHHLPAYLQQLQMESNGKSVRQDGSPVMQATAPVVWGSVGTPAQHAYFQLLHQGTDIVPVEFIVAAQPVEADEDAHKELLANCLAQAAALMEGAGETSGGEAHRRCAGERPSVLLMHRQLTPFALGRLLALYEHRTFVEAVLWGINPFDQWGVELGKRMAQEVRPLLDGKGEAANPSTRGILRHYKQLTEDS